MENKKKRPLLKDLARVDKIFWTNEDIKWIKHIPYKIKEEVIDNPPEGGNEVTSKDLEKLTNMINEKFEKQSIQINSIKTEFNEKIEKQSSQIDSIRIEFNEKFDKQSARLDKLETKIDDLTLIVKKNHPEDF